MTKSARFDLSYLLIAVLGALFVHHSWTSTKSVAVLPHGEFRRLLSDRKVA